MKITFARQALITIATGLMLSVATHAAEVSSNKAAAKHEARTAALTRTQLDALLAHPEQVLIIDVRRPDEITAIGGLPVYLSVQLHDLEKNLAWIPKDRQIVTVSNHAGRAGRAGDLLAAKGFNVVGRVGVQDYEAQGGKLTKIAPKPAATASHAVSKAQ